MDVFPALPDTGMQDKTNMAILGNCSFHIDTFVDNYNQASKPHLVRRYLVVSATISCLESEWFWALSGRTHRWRSQMPFTIPHVRGEGRSISAYAHAAQKPIIPNLLASALWMTKTAMNNLTYNRLIYQRESSVL